MNITETDAELLRYLHAVKVATLRQIKRDIFPTYHIRSVSNRLAKLEMVGLVTGVRNRRFAKGEKILSVSKKGFLDFVAQGFERRCELKSEAINHDIQLVDIRSIFLNLEQVSNYYTENQLQTWDHVDLNLPSANLVKLNSDAVANIHMPGGNIVAAVEYEASDKASQRYDPIVHKYYHCEEVGAVFYLCKTENQMRKVITAERALYSGEQPKFFYILADNLEVGKSVSFRNFNHYPLTFTTKLP